MLDTEYIGMLIKRIHDSISKNVNQKVKSLDLTFSQIRILAYLREAGEKTVTQKELEDYFEISHPTIVGILKRLESKGLVTCAFDAADRRMKNVFLTQKEAAIYHEMMQQSAQTEMQLCRGMTPDQIRTLKTLLLMVYENSKP